MSSLFYSSGLKNVIINKRKFLYRNINFRTLCSYTNTYYKSIKNREEFWAEKSQSITWFKKWNKVLKADDIRSPKWFDGGELNTCYNCVDRHVEAGFGSQKAIIYDSPISNKKKFLTYDDLHAQVNLLSGALSRCGVKKGDRVLLYMPVIPETIVSMLASARLGAIHSMVFGGFAAKELATRISHAKPRVIISANCGLEPGRVINYKSILDDAIKISGHSPKNCIIYNRPGYPEASLDANKGDLVWDEVMEWGLKHDPVPVESDDPLYIIYTSGTTGTPKGIVRPNGGHAVALNWAIEGVYDIKPGEVWWSNSDFGWTVGHSFTCYAPLLHRNTTVVYEGKPVGTPDASQIVRVFSEHKPVSHFLAPTALRALRRVDPDGQEGQQYKYPDMRVIYVAGERCDEETLLWARERFQLPVLDHWWQTETGWPMTSPCVGLNDSLHPPVGCAGRAVPGYEIVIQKSAELLEETDAAHDEHLGNIIVKLPMPPGVSNTFWENHQLYLDTYFQKFPGYYDTMDAGYMDDEGYIFIMARVDDVINVAGHRLSTGSLEEACLKNPDIVDCAVVGIPDQLRGEIPLGVLVQDSRIKKAPDQIIKETIEIIRNSVGAVAFFKRAIIVPALPKTRSGKTARSTIAAMAAGKPFKIPVTIEDPAVYDSLKIALEKAGFNPSTPN